MKVGLRDSCDGSTVLGRVVLDGDGCEPCGQVPVACPEEPVDDGLRTVELRRRYREGYDADDNPVFVWDTVWRGGAMVFETRNEFDPAAGITIVVGDVKIPNFGVDELIETHMLVEPTDPEVLWMITGSKVGAVSIDLKTRRIDA